MSGGPAIRLFGPVVVVHEGVARSAGGPRQATVLAVLASAAGRPVSAERLIDAVWTDPPDTVTNTLQVYVSALRRLLRTAGLSIDRMGGAYALCAALDDIDVELFQRHASQGRAALVAGAPDDALESLDRAAALWDPSPLAGLGDSSFVIAARAALLSAGLGMGIDRGVALCAVGRPDEAAAAAQRLVEVAPYHEPAWELLMRAHYHAGRAHEALRAFTRARRLLVDELGLEPSPQLRELEREILDHTVAPIIPVSTAGVPAPTASTLRPRLPSPVTEVVGRDAEVARVVDLTGAGARLVSLVGLGGIGKTTTALAAAHVLAGAGRDVAFADLVGVLDADTAASRMAEVVGVEPGASRPWEALQQADPAVLVVADNCEQVEDFGPAVAGLLRSTERLAFVVTSRTPLRIRAEHLVPIQPLGVKVDGVPGDANRLFVARAAQGGRHLGLDATDPTVRAICDLAGGIPLAVELAARQLGRLTPAALLQRLRAGRTTLLDATGVQDVPERQHSLRTVLDATLAGLSDQELVLARRLAVVPGPVTLDLLDALTGDTPTLLDRLDDLVQLGVVAGPDERDRYRMPVPVAEHVLSRGDGGRAEAGRLVEAVLARAESSAGATDDRGQWAEAALAADAAAISAACTATIARDDTASGARLVRALRRYWLVSSTFTEAELVCRALLALDPAPADRANLMLVLGTFASLVHGRDALPDLRAAIDVAAEGVGADEELVLQALCYLGSVLCDLGDLDGARAVASRVEELTAEGPDARAELGRSFRAFVANRCGDFDVAVELSAESLAILRRRGDRYLLVDALYRQAESLLELGRVDEAERLMDEAIQTARVTTIGPLAALVYVVQAAVDVARGRLSSAAGWATAALRIATERVPYPFAETNALLVLAVLRAAAGDDEPRDVASALLTTRSAGPVVRARRQPRYTTWRQRWTRCGSPPRPRSPPVSSTRVR